MADQKIDGALFKSMVIEGALAIAENKERANELNVFPVPDGDTGTNMSMTMASAMTELDKLEAKLGNPGFVNKAPAHVVEAEQDRAEKLRALLAKLEESAASMA